MKIHSVGAQVLPCRQSDRETWWS